MQDLKDLVWLMLQRRGQEVELPKSLPEVKAEIEVVEAKLAVTPTRELKRRLCALGNLKITLELGGAS